MSGNGGRIVGGIWRMPSSISGFFERIGWRRRVGVGGAKVMTSVNSLMTSYEDLIGIKQVKEAQARVLQAEIEFGEAQESRRRAQRDLSSLELRLREVRYDLDKTPRGEENYLNLVKREIELLREEKIKRDEFQRQEKQERDLFGSLSSALRGSHEKERAQGEKTKYWSIFGSILGIFLGMGATTISSKIKMNQLKTLVAELGENRMEGEQKLLITLDRINQLLSTLEQRQKEVKGEEVDQWTRVDPLSVQQVCPTSLSPQGEEIVWKSKQILIPSILTGLFLLFIFKSSL